MQALEPERLNCTLIQPPICPTTAEDLHALSSTAPPMASWPTSSAPFARSATNTGSKSWDSSVPENPLRSTYNVEGCR